MERRAPRLSKRNRGHGECACIEQLEARALLTGFAWTAQEVYLAELVNRARANPLAEGARLGIDLSVGLDSAELARLVAQEPLALNEYLTVAARAQSLDMAERDFFDHVNPDGLDPTQRAQAAGYTGTAGENIAAGYSSIDEVHAAWLTSLGHRRNVFSLHSTFDDEFHYDEFGPGFAFTQIGPFFDYYSQEFGAQAAPARLFVLGVAFTDSNSNNFYNVGEGMGDVRVDVAPLAEPWNVVGTYTTDSAGNYQIPVLPGSYLLTFTNLANNQAKVSYLSVEGTNVKVDAKASQFGAPLAPYRAVYGRAIAASSSAAGRISVSTINQGAQPVALIQNSAGTDWSGYDLTALTGAPAVSGQVVSWTDSKDGLQYAAASGSSGVILYKQVNGTTWSYRNLTTESSGETVPGGQLVVLQGTDGLVRLAGLAGDGDLVVYAQTGAGSAGSYAWSFTNLATHDLAPQSMAMPQLVGEITGYVTSWNGLNVAGLDSSGQIHTVWWAPGIDLWRTTNLSEITGAPAFTGGLTAYLTSWDGINIGGITADGSLSVTWWVPSFGGNWLTNNLTAEFSGPNLVASSVSSYVTSWGGMNVAGIDNAGRVVVYWWAPEISATGWQVTALSDVISGAPRLEGRIMGLATPTGVLNVLGYTGVGDIVRYHWQPGSSWASENISVMAGT